ncbi:NACHT domain-containing protein [Streptosporangium sp. CA-135522]|uniref:NACHT domain-containing protein n=1 Tax=Streptosporangium sp. CA-135522 TaxID=3240072 RepID=UPI003D949624
MKWRRARRRRGGSGIQASGPASMAAGGDIVNPQTHIGQLHVRQPALGPGEVEFTARKLAEQVREQWENEARRRSLAYPDPIPVGWRFRPSLSDQPGAIDPPETGEAASRWEDASSGDIGGLTERFRQTRRRRLVLVGGPGSGKTTLAVQLLLRLLRTRLPGEAVPVLLPVSGWNTDRFPKLHSWLEDRLTRDYPMLRSKEHAPTVHALVAGHHVLPVLDGLDELPEGTQGKVIAALNRSLGDDDQLILTSRTKEFRTAVRTVGDVITSSATLQARPLPPTVAADYLGSLSPIKAKAWRPVLDGLRTADAGGGTGPWDALAAVTTVPLGLWLLRTVYDVPGSDPAELAGFPSSEALRTHLFDRLAAAVIATRPSGDRPPAGHPEEQLLPRRRYDPADVERWLGFLADFLTRKARTRDLAWWLLTSAVYNPPAAPFSMGTQNYIPGYYDSYTPPPSWADARLATLNLTLSGRVGALGRKLALALTIGLVGGALLASFVYYAMTDWRVFAVPFGFSFAVIMALPIALQDWAEVPVSTADPTTPMTSWRGARAVGRFHTCTTTLVGALAAGLSFGPVWGWLPGLLIAAPVGALTGWVVGWSYWREQAAWGRYSAAARRLAKGQGFPRDLIGFLDDAHRLGLLRTVGPIYQFRHAEYHDHLARRNLYSDPPW